MDGFELQPKLQLSDVASILAKDAGLWCRTRADPSAASRSLPPHRSV